MTSGSRGRCANRSASMTGILWRSRSEKIGAHTKLRCSAPTSAGDCPGPLDRRVAPDAVQLAIGLIDPVRIEAVAPRPACGPGSSGRRRLSGRYRRVPLRAGPCASSPSPGRGSGLGRVIGSDRAAPSPNSGGAVLRSKFRTLKGVERCTSGAKTGARIRAGRWFCGPPRARERGRESG